MLTSVRTGMPLAGWASCRWWHFTWCGDQALGPTPKSCTSSSVTGSRCCAKPLPSAPAGGSIHMSATLTPSCCCLPAVPEGQEQHPKQLHAQAAQAPARPAAGGREAAGCGPHRGLSVWKWGGSLPPDFGAVLTGDGVHHGLSVWQRAGGLTPHPGAVHTGDIL